MLKTRNILSLTQAIASNPSEDHSLSRLAQRYGVSKFHLQREFTQVTRETPKQYVMRLRLERAATQLSASDKSVLSIALDFGFASHEVFTRAFRRHFGCTPLQFRARTSANFISKNNKQKNLNRNVVDNVVPCINLFHMESINQKRKTQMATSEITRKSVEVQPILYIRKEVDPSKLSAFFAENFTKIFTYAMTNGCEIAGNPMARYIKVGQGLWTVDAILPLLKSEHGEDEIVSGSLHGGFVATATHSGSYETLPETYSAIDQWIRDNGYIGLGGNWEWYVTDPGQHPDPNDWKTEVYWPLAE